MLTRKLSGDHCRCSTCREYFNSTSAFDRHRTGDYAGRRCLTVDEMHAKGMVISATGWWLGSAWKGPSLPLCEGQTAAIGIDPLEERGSDTASAASSASWQTS